jgi:hypothetical protein
LEPFKYDENLKTTPTKVLVHLFLNFVSLISYWSFTWRCHGTIDSYGIERIVWIVWIVEMIEMIEGNKYLIEVIESFSDLWI